MLVDSSDGALGLRELISIGLNVQQVLVVLAAGPFFLLLGVCSQRPC